MASVFWKAKEYEYEKVLLTSGYKNHALKLGKLHSFVGVDMMNLSSVSAVEGDLEKAESLCRRSIEVLTRNLGEESIEVAKGYNNLAILFKMQGHVGKAKENFEKALNLLERLPADSIIHERNVRPLITYVRSGLAGCLMLVGETAQAEQYYTKVMEEHKDRSNDGSLDMAYDQNNIGNILCAKGQYSDAKSMYKKALKCISTKLGKQHPELGPVLANLAFVSEKLGRPSKALQEWQLAIAMADTQYGKDSIMFATRVLHMGNLLLRVGKLDSAMECFACCGSVFEKANTESLLYAHSVVGLGLVLMKKGSKRRAMKFLSTGLGLIEKHVKFENEKTLNDEDLEDVEYTESGKQEAPLMEGRGGKKLDISMLGGGARKKAGAADEDGGKEKKLKVDAKNIRKILGLPPLENGQTSFGDDSDDDASEDENKTPILTSKSQLAKMKNMGKSIATTYGRPSEGSRLEEYIRTRRQSQLEDTGVAEKVIIGDLSELLQHFDEPIPWVYLDDFDEQWQDGSISQRDPNDPRWRLTNQYTHSSLLSNTLLHSELAKVPTNCLDSTTATCAENKENNGASPLKIAKKKFIDAVLSQTFPPRGKYTLNTRQERRSALDIWREDYDGDVDDSEEVLETVVEEKEEPPASPIDEKVGFSDSTATIGFSESGKKLYARRNAPAMVISTNLSSNISNHAAVKSATLGEGKNVRVMAVQPLTAMPKRLNIGADTVGGENQGDIIPLGPLETENNSNDDGRAMKEENIHKPLSRHRIGTPFADARKGTPGEGISRTLSRGRMKVLSRHGSSRGLSTQGSVRSLSRRTPSRGKSMRSLLTTPVHDSQEDPSLTPGVARAVLSSFKDLFLSDDHDDIENCNPNEEPQDWAEPPSAKSVTKPMFLAELKRKKGVADSSQPTTPGTDFTNDPSLKAVKSEQMMLRKKTTETSTRPKSFYRSPFTPLSRENSRSIKSPNESERLTPPLSSKTEAQEAVMVRSLFEELGDKSVPGNIPSGKKILPRLATGKTERKIDKFRSATAQSMLSKARATSKMPDSDVESGIRSKTAEYGQKRQHDDIFQGEAITIPSPKAKEATPPPTLPPSGRLPGSSVLNNDSALTQAIQKLERKKMKSNMSDMTMFNTNPLGFNDGNNQPNIEVTGIEWNVGLECMDSPVRIPKTPVIFEGKETPSLGNTLSPMQSPNLHAVPDLSFNTVYVPPLDESMFNVEGVRNKFYGNRPDFLPKKAATRSLWLEVYMGLSKTHELLDDWKMAECIQRRIVMSMQYLYGANHQKTTSALLALARIFIKSERYEHADKLLSKLLVLFEAVNGKDDIRNSEIEYMLGDLYIARGDKKKGEELQRKINEARFNAAREEELRKKEAEERLHQRREIELMQYEDMYGALREDWDRKITQMSTLAEDIAEWKAKQDVRRMKALERVQKQQSETSEGLTARSARNQPGAITRRLQATGLMTGRKGVKMTARPTGRRMSKMATGQETSRKRGDMTSRGVTTSRRNPGSETSRQGGNETRRVHRATGEK